MGAGQSTSETSVPSRALHILRVTPGSPASRTEIEPFFSFITGIDLDGFDSNILPELDTSELERIVEAHEGKTLRLLVWNAKHQDTQVVPITPSRAWSQQSQSPIDGSTPFQPSLLGLSMRVCEPEFAMDNVWHVLDVVEGSPAESAGLVPMGDWVLGFSGGVLSAENDFYDLVEAHVDKPLRVYVYSYDFDALREVVLIPNKHWGGEGLLGCVFGFGLLHRIPVQARGRSGAILPPELQGDGEFEEQGLFVPADSLDGPSASYTHPSSNGTYGEIDHEAGAHEMVKEAGETVTPRKSDGVHAAETQIDSRIRPPIDIRRTSSPSIRVPNVFSPPLSNRQAPTTSTENEADGDSNSETDERTSQSSLTSVD